MLRQLQTTLSANDLLKGQFGVEREALRVNLDGTLAMTPHPKVFGDKLSNPYITTDFSESQIEMITPPRERLEETYEFLQTLYQLTVSELQGELLWPQSMPCVLEDDQEIPIASFHESEEGSQAMSYRQFLLQKYGGKRQLISGIHYNFSFSTTLLEKLYTHANFDGDFALFKNQIYLKVTRNYLRYRWLLVYFLGASPVIDKSYCEDCSTLMHEMVTDGHVKPKSVSLRNTPCGYQNKKILHARYETTQDYVDSLQEHIDSGEITSVKEFYSSIRLKSKEKDTLLDNLVERGIEYLEIRSIDVNPFETVGIALDDLKFIHLFVLFLLDHDEYAFTDWQMEGDHNEQLVAVGGLNPDMLLTRAGEQLTLKEWATAVLKQMNDLNEMFDLRLGTVIQDKLQQLKDSQLTLAGRYIKELQQLGYVQANLALALKHKKEAMKHPYMIPGFEDLELSTQLLVAESIKRGVDVKILDRVENFIQLRKSHEVHLVKQATKTSLDNYITVLAMENKEVTKQILRQHGVSVPEGQLFDSYEEAIAAFDDMLGHSIVIKPKSTNFGKGITMLDPLETYEVYEAALDVAFSHDQSVIVEAFQRGNEYRFLVIEGELVGVLQRIPANVIGDGVHTIAELVDIKNQHSLRGIDYKRPLEKIKIDKQVHYYLQVQGYTEATVLPKGLQIFLRENSNISTGGDSLDMTDKIPQRFKDYATLAASQIGARICGVDMIIEDIENPLSNYSIIELNFNPAIHIHAYPYEGKSRNAAPLILKALGLEQSEGRN